MAAHKRGHRGYGIELDPLYCDVIVRRLSEVTRLSARPLEIGHLFTDEKTMAIAVSSAPKTMPQRTKIPGHFPRQMPGP